MIPFIAFVKRGTLGGHRDEGVSQTSILVTVAFQHRMLWMWQFACKDRGMIILGWQINIRAGGALTAQNVFSGFNSRYPHSTGSSQLKALHA